MCRTIHAMVSTIICGIQMIVRVFMTTVLMIENIIRMVLQTLYNFFSFMLQMISLIPICVVFLLTARLKCFMCGGGGPCPVNRGGACDCLMSLFAIIILFFIFRATGVLDKIFYSIGYAKATTHIARFVPTPGEITECSRNDTDTEYIFYPIETTTEEYEEEEETTSTTFYTTTTTFTTAVIRFTEHRTTTLSTTLYTTTELISTTETTSTTTTTDTTTTEQTPPAFLRGGLEEDINLRNKDTPGWWLKQHTATPETTTGLGNRFQLDPRNPNQWTTVLYYLI